MPQAGLGLQEDKLLLAPSGGSVTKQTRGGGGGERYTITERTPHFLPGGSPPPTRFALPSARERHLSMPEIGEKERNYLFKSYQT